MSKIVDSITQMYEPLENKKHCRIFKIIMIAISITMLLLLVSAIIVLKDSKDSSFALAVSLQLVMYAISFYMYRIIYSMCVKTL